MSRNNQIDMSRQLGGDFRIPAEWEPHECCWMAWAVHREWGEATNLVKRELSQVIQTIARYEPVRVLASRGNGANEARREFSSCKNIAVVEAPVDDIWMRDIAPSFGFRQNGRLQEVVSIDWNFNAWGKSRVSRRGDQLAKTAASIFGVPRVSVPFVAEGGALVADGQGTLITTRSCLLNPNRNPVCKTSDRQLMIENEMAKLGITNMIWLEGDPCEPITSGHADGYVLFAPSRTVLVEVNDDPAVEAPMWRAHDVAILENAFDAQARRLKVVQVLGPRSRYLSGYSEFFAPSYLNAYIANGAVIGARYGDAQRDMAAESALRRAFPKRAIVMLNIDHIANGGGGVHCLTQPMPKDMRP